MHRLIFLITISSNFVLLPIASGATDQTQISTTERIKRLPVFAQPVIPIDATQLSETESAEVLRLLEQLRAS